MTEVKGPVKHTLTKEDFDSAAWKRLTQYLEARLNELRLQNDGDLSDRDTAKLRGRIKELKHLSALDRPPPSIGEDER